jgi:hypothetical protein
MVLGWARTVIGAKNTSVRLTGGRRAPVRWSTTSGRARRSRRWSAHHLRWSGRYGPRAQAGELVSGEGSGLITVVGLNQTMQWASLGPMEYVGASDWTMAYPLALATRAGGEETPVRVDRRLRWGSACFLLQEAPLGSREVGRGTGSSGGGRGRVWPWWSCSGGGCRWYCSANSGELWFGRGVGVRGGTTEVVLLL